MPHISARGFAGAGYGVGYAQARDALCVLADAYITGDAERSRFLGPDGTLDGFSSETAPNPIANLASDLYFQRLIDTGEVDRMVAQPAPQGPRREARELVRGFVGGYNRYLGEVDVDAIEDPACRGAAWVRPISQATAWRYLHVTATLASTSTLLNSIAAAQPPAETGTPGTVPDDALAQARGTLVRVLATLAAWHGIDPQAPAQATCSPPPSTPSAPTSPPCSPDLRGRGGGGGSWRGRCAGRGCAGPGCGRWAAGCGCGRGGGSG